MGLLSNRIDRQSLKPGDHIYTWRQGFIYSHHGIYIGDGKVIHFTQGPADAESRILISSSTPQFYNSHSCAHCSSNSRAKGVILTCIDGFLSGGHQELNLFEYGVTEGYFLAKLRGGTCPLAKSDPPEDVLHRAIVLLQSNGFGEYDVFKKNCEDFALYCKTGLLVTSSSSGAASSGQVTALGAAAGILTSFACSSRGYGGLALLAGGVNYCHRRLTLDIGVRQDVAKVPVERLVASPSSYI